MSGRSLTVQPVLRRRKRKQRVFHFQEAVAIVCGHKRIVGLARAFASPFPECRCIELIGRHRCTIHFTVQSVIQLSPDRDQ